MYKLKKSLSVVQSILQFTIISLSLSPIYAGDIEQILPSESNFTIDGDGGAEVMRVQSDGLVGIGTVTPHEKLEVNGHIRMTDGNEAANTVMVGDADGTASWAPVSSIQDGTGTDDQNLTDFNLSGTTLSLTIEDGNTITVDLSSLNNSGTDDQQITDFNLTGTVLSITLENGGTKSVDLADLNDTAAIEALQTLIEDQIDDINATVTGHIAADDDTDKTNELITDANFSGDILVITENGVNHEVNLSTLNNSGSDDQILELNDTVLSIENGNSIDLNLTFATNEALQSHIDDDNDTNASNELLEDVNFSSNILTIKDAGDTYTLDFSALDNNGTDDQTLTLEKNGTLSIEDGNSIDLNATFATDEELNASISDLNETLASHIAEDNDTDARNELITATDFNGSHITINEANDHRSVRSERLRIRSGTRSEGGRYQRDAHRGGRGSQRDTCKPHCGG